MYHKKIPLWIKWMTFFFYVFHWQFPTTLANTHFKYMTNYCSKTLEVHQSLLMALTPESHLPTDRNRDFIHCDVNLEAPAGMKLFVHFLQLGILPAIQQPDRLQLFDMKPTKKRLTPEKGLYGKLDRSLFMFDDSGSEVKDYWTSSNVLRLDYLGKPTKKSSGFRILVTAFRDAGSGGDCPAKHYRCQRRNICIPRQTTCDGLPNCGRDDTGDEEGCDRDDTVTNLLAEYSLARDILVVVMLPVVIFLAMVVIIFALAKRYIRKKINIPEPPAVRFTSQKDGGKITISDNARLRRLYAPPSYEDVMNPPTGYGPPPAYSSLADLVRAGRVEVVDSEDEARAANMANDRRHRHRRHMTKGSQGSASSLEDQSALGRPAAGRGLTQSEYENYRLHGVWPSDTDDDEEMKEKRRRKGGKCKSKGKRYAHNGDGINNSKSSLHGVSPLASPSSNSAHSVPSAETAATPADSNSPTASSPDLPPYSGSNSNSSSSTPRKQPTKTVHKRTGKRRTDDFIPIHADPNKSSSPRVPCTADVTNECQKSETSSCGETDHKSETESRSPSKRNSFTESNASLTERSGSRKTLDANSDLLDEADENIDNSIDKLHSKSKDKSKLIADDSDADVSSESESEGMKETDFLKGKIVPLHPDTKDTDNHISV